MRARIMRVFLVTALVLAACFAGQSPRAAQADADWVAYNDCVHGGSPANTTIYSAYMGDGGGFEDPDGYLKDSATGLFTSVWVDMTGSNISGSISAPPDPGTDAYDTFQLGVAGVGVDLGDWSTSYNSSSMDWYYQVTFTGLDPSKSYEFATTANRNNPSYAGDGSSSRWTKFGIIGADTYTNASTPGVVEVSPDVVKFNTGYNTVNGYVARWTGVTAADGSFSVRSENVGAAGPGEPRKSYGMEGFVLKEQGAPSPTEAWVDPDYDDASCTADGHTWQYDCFDTIQDGIDAVSGSTVYVAAGTYNSSSETFPIVINKSLTLLGAQANVDPRPSQGGRSGAESIIDADETSSAVIQISASDVEINGFTITGGTGDMVEESGSADNLLFRYNILYDDLGTSGDEAIQIKYSDGVVMEYNYAYDILEDGFNLSASTNGVVRYNEAHDIYSENAAIYCYDETNIDIIGNLVYDVPNNDGIKLGDSGDGSTGGEVKDNVAHHCAEDGITIYASGVTVENNTVHDCDSENGAMYLYGADNSTVTGNEIYDNDAIGLLIHNTSDVAVTHNEIHSNDDTNDTKYSGSAGIWVTDQSDASTITVNSNAIYDNADYGVRNDDTSMLDAENNWWGDVSGPNDPTGTVEVPPCTADPASEKNADGTGNGVTDNVDYCPWTTAVLWSDPADPGWLATCEDETLTVDVLLTADDFNGVEFNLDFDASALEVTDLSMGSMWPAGATNVQNVIDNTNGFVEFAAYLQQADTNISVTDGQVAQITFKELGTAGDYLLDFNDVIVSNSEGQSIPVHLEDGSLEVKGCGCVHGIVEVQGRFGDWDCADITVSGGPGGSYNTHVDNLDGTWQICDIVEGDYDVEVEMALYLDGLKEDVSIVDAGDTDVGQVKVLGGDCNDGDGSSPCGSPYYGVNINDATIVGGEFGNSGVGIGDDRADINDDGTVNILDASLLGGNWHKCSPVPW